MLSRPVKEIKFIVLPISKFPSTEVILVKPLKSFISESKPTPPISKSPVIISYPNNAKLSTSTCVTKSTSP